MEKTNLKPLTTRSILMLAVNTTALTVTYDPSKGLLVIEERFGRTSEGDYMGKPPCRRCGAEVEEACRLVDAGFEYVCDMENAKIFRKRK